MPSLRWMSDIFQTLQKNNITINFVIRAIWFYNDLTINIGSMCAHTAPVKSLETPSYSRQ